MFARFVHKCLKFTKSYVTFLHLNAGVKSCTACSTSSSLLIVLTHTTKKKKKQLHYTLNTQHQTLHYILTIYSKHAMCHKSLNSQKSRFQFVFPAYPVLNCQFRCTERDRTADKIPVQLRLFLKVCHGSELYSDWLWCARGYGGYGWQC